MAMQNFLAAMRRQTAPIDQQLNRLMQAQIDENREKMKSIVKTVIFCGQNNIPLRGKRDDNPDNSNLQGNFQALLEFRIDSGDVKLKEHLENAPRNATYRSKTIQNEIIETVGNYISSKIIAEVKQTRMFSVMADEAADVSNKENLSLVLRYVDSSKNIREEFVGFRLCGEETTGNATKELIINSVRDLGLTMDNCRGQSYDGAGNMDGRYVGASTLIQHQFPKAIYVHCMNHRLNLCEITSCSCERSVSCLRYLKNYLRGTMGEERLNGLALMHAHRDIALDLDEIINLFTSLHPRRMRMANILCSDD